MEKDSVEFNNLLNSFDIFGGLIAGNLGRIRSNENAGNMFLVQSVQCVVNIGDKMEEANVVVFQIH